MALIVEFIGFILELITDIIFWRDKKKRRQFEKENNLPKKLMINPNTKALLYFGGIVLVISIVIPIYKHYYSNKKETYKKLLKIETLLIDNKKADGIYPEQLEHIIRNNPFRQNINQDSWGNPYHYQVLDQGAQFVLVSKGKDGILNTDDDLKLEKK